MKVGIANPLWFVLLALPAGLVFWYIRSRRNREEIEYKNKHIQHLVQFQVSEWRRHLSVGVTTLVMLVMVMLVADTISWTTTTEQSKALVVWAYDRSSSMEKEDVVYDGKTVSRDQAVFFALGQSLPSVPSDYDKLLVSYSDPENLTVGIPTRSNKAFLAQAENLESGVTTAIDVGLSGQLNACKVARDEYGTDTPCLLILMSDGRCEPDIVACESRARELAEEAKEMNAPINTVAFGSDADIEFLDHIAVLSGGQSMTTSSVEDLTAMYNDITGSLTPVDVSARIPLQIRLVLLALMLLGSIPFVFRLIRDD